MSRRPLSVWATAQKDLRRQLAGRYLPGSETAPTTLLPDVARTVIAAYSQPGDLVVDPMCGTGVSLVEAVHLARDAIGVEAEPGWADLATANLAHARNHGAIGQGHVVVGNPRQLADQLSLVHRTVALTLTSLTASADDALELQLDAARDLFDGCRQVLRPGGYVVLVVQPSWYGDDLIDLPGMLVRLSEAAGLTLYERNVALVAALQGDRLIPSASAVEVAEVRAARARGIPRLVVAHQDVLVFTSTSK